MGDNFTRYLVMSVVFHGALTGGIAGFSMTMSRPKFTPPKHIIGRVIELPGSRNAPPSAMTLPPTPVPAAPTPAPPPKAEPKPEEQVKTQKKKPETKPAPPSKKKPEKKPEPDTKGQVREDPRTGGFKGKVESPAAPPSILPGGGSASLGIDAADFTYSYYLITIQNAVAREWSAPAGAAGERLAVIYFTIERDGRVVRPMIETKSGDDLFDRTALRAVERAQLPPLPDEFADRSIGIHFQFEYAR